LKIAFAIQLILLCPDLPGIIYRQALRQTELSGKIEIHLRSNFR
jgi:hypothetical protein